MNVVRLLGGGVSPDVRSIMITTCLAGLGNAALIGLVNMVAGHVSQARPVGAGLLLVYIAIFCFFYVSNRASLREANRYVQRRLGALRQRVFRKIQRADLRRLERMGQGEIYATVAQEIDHLSQNLPFLVAAAQSAFILVFLLLYVATLSLVSFLVLAALGVIGICIFAVRHRALTEALTDVHRAEAEMLESLTHFTSGFQEIRLNADKNDSLFRHFTGIVDRLKRLLIGIGGKWASLLQFSDAFFFAMVGVVVFVLPIYFHGYTDVIYKITAAAIFALGPVTAITASARLYSRAEAGLGHVYRLERRLDENAAPQTDGPPSDVSRFRDFREIAYEKIAFRYRDADGSPSFVTGPWDLTLQRGEIVFLTGGNGSGKSTALKIVCGLYTPGSGEILCDGTAIDEGNRQEFREIFSAIFSDFHLFDRLYGFEDVEASRVEELIGRMELGDKVRFENGRFNTTDLSTGQRKRLAMIASLLEDREIYLFDEWAADQDAHFRDVFYHELLPDLKRQGKTVVAVTHDDRYWSCCDRRLVFDLGNMSPARED
ncbi:MAG: cyclic peptide export ABC transporter [Rhodospirillaceae bacterium]